MSFLFHLLWIYFFLSRCFRRNYNDSHCNCYTQNVKGRKALFQLSFHSIGSTSTLCLSCTCTPVSLFIFLLNKPFKKHKLFRVKYPIQNAIFMSSFEFHMRKNFSILLTLGKIKMHSICISISRGQRTHRNLGTSVISSYPPHA